jgi:anion-transporting  ArsA/GET3 family ATPase
MNLSLTESQLNELFSKKLIMVTGKGGIGKTTIAASLGQAAASTGLNTLILECSAQDQIAPLFGEAASGRNKIKINEKLTCHNLSNKDNLKEYITKYLGQELLYEKVFTNKMVKSFFNVIPGFSEVMLLGRLFYTCELAGDDCPDLVIFDAPASGHFLSLMTTPNAIEDTKLGGPLVTETVRVREFLADSEKCGTIYVGVPEDLVVSEMLDFIPRLVQESPSELSAVILNRSLGHLRDEFDQVGEASDTKKWTRRIEKSTQSANLLREGMKSFSIDTPVVEMPELGFIDEPLENDFGKNFLRGQL